MGMIPLARHHDVSGTTELLVGRHVRGAPNERMRGQRLGPPDLPSEGYERHQDLIGPRPRRQGGRLTDGDPPNGLPRVPSLAHDEDFIRSSDKHVFEMLGHIAVRDFCQILSDLSDDFGANAVGDRSPQIA
jgi:hypothetical protein